MSRRKRAREITGVQLFPFLAVLLCTMGALIVVLVIVAQQARAQARLDYAHQDSGPSQSELVEREQLRQRADELKRKLAAAAATVDQKQKDAAQLEQSLRHTLREIEEWRARQQDLARATGDAAVVDALRRQAAELDAKIRERQAALLSQKQNGTEPVELYSIIPYAGRNGATRRPVYIECKADRVILQPEGVELPSADFEVLGPGNPLEAAVRATVIHWERTLGENAGRPYPLLLVRPEGVTAYHAVREALSTWGTEFGYELVDTDWNVALPQADAILAQQQRAAIETAREQMQKLASDRSRRRRSSPTFKVSQSGSLERIDSGDEESGLSRRRGPFGEPLAGAAAGEQPFGTGLAGDDPVLDNLPLHRGSGGAPRGQPGENPLAASGGRQPPGDSTQGANRQYPNPLGNGNQDSPFGGTSGGGQPNPLKPMFGEHGRGAPGTEFSAAGQPGGPESDGFANGSVGRQRTQSNFGSPSGGTPPESFGKSGGEGDRSSTTAARNPNCATPSGTPGAAAGSRSFSAGSAGTPRSSFSGPPPAGATDGPGGTAAIEMSDNGGPPTAATGGPGGPSCIADQQGANWALPERPNRGISPLRRTVRLLIDVDTVIVFADPRGTRTLDIIRVDRGATDAVDQLKTAVWKIMESWGAAPPGFHWRPVLRAEVNPRGALRYQELSILMRNSGFELTDQKG